MPAYAYAVNGLGHIRIPTTWRHSIVAFLQLIQTEGIREFVQKQNFRFLWETTQFLIFSWAVESIEFESVAVPFYWNWEACLNGVESLCLCDLSG